MVLRDAFARYRRHPAGIGLVGLSNRAAETAAVHCGVAAFAAIRSPC